MNAPLSTLLLNALKNVDITFFLICGAIVVVCIAIYFLIPVFKKSQYEERRENLRKREAAFKSGRQLSRTDGKVCEVSTEKPTSDEID